MSKEKAIFFPPFKLDRADQRLFRGQTGIPLRPKAFEVLQYLAERPGRLVTKNELLDAVWPDTTVTDTVLKVCIREIREALADDPGSPRFIETSHRRGYRFVGEVRPSGEGEPAAVALTKTRIELHTRVRNGEPSVVGRDDEIARLIEFLDRAIDGQRQIVFITGEPGIGKTSLVEAFLNQVSDSRDVLIARGQCLEQYGAAEAFLPMLEAVSRLCREPGSEHVRDLLRAHAPTLIAQIPWLAREHEREALQREMLGATRERMLREMAEAVETLSLSIPMVLLIEDLHWSDYSTVDLVSYLARRREPAPLMLIGTYRPAEAISSRHPLGDVKRELKAHRQCEELALTLLDERAVAQYVASRFPSNEFPSELALLIHRRTDGNPLFIINLVDFLVSKGLIVNYGDEWRLAESLREADIGMPDNVRQMIEKQIDGLSEQEQRVLEAGAVAGVEFSNSTISAAIGEGILQSEESCDGLARRHMFLRYIGGNQPPEDETAGRYGFIHALYQNVLYDRVPPARRAHVHRQIGLHLESAFGSRAAEMAAELAMHFENARDYSRAVYYLQQAAENAKRRFANHETVELARRGLQLVGKLVDAPEKLEHELLLQTSLAVALSATQGYGSAEVETAYHRARELCHRSGNRLQLFPVLWGLWRFYLIRSQLKVARELAQELLELSGSAQDSALLVEAHLAAGTTFDNLGEFDSARKHFELGGSVYDPQRIQSHLLLYGHDPQVALRCFNAWALWSLGYPDLALETARDAVTLAQQLQHPETLCFAFFFAAWVHQLRRESEETLRYAEDTIELASKNGILQWIAFSSSLRGWALTELGRAPEGIAQMLDTLELYRSIGSEISRPHFLALLAEALIGRGEVEQALDALNEGLSAAEDTQQRYYESELHRLRGEVFLVQPDNLGASERCFQRAIEIAREQNAKSFELRSAVSLAGVLKKTGRREEARSKLAIIYDGFTEGFGTKDLKQAKTLLDELKSGTSR